MVSIAVLFFYSQRSRFCRSFDCGFAGRLDLSASSSNDSVMTVSTVEYSEGVANLDFFTFKVNGYISHPVKYNASIFTVAYEVRSFFGPRCPYELEWGLPVNHFLY